MFRYTSILQQSYLISVPHFQTNRASVTAYAIKFITLARNLPSEKKTGKQAGSADMAVPMWSVECILRRVWGSQVHGWGRGDDAHVISSSSPPILSKSSVQYHAITPSQGGLAKVEDPHSTHGIQNSGKYEVGRRENDKECAKEA